MIFIDQSFEIIRDNTINSIEIAGRTCYQSFKDSDQNTTNKFINMLIEKGHHAMIEFFTVTIKMSSDVWKIIERVICPRENLRYIIVNNYTNNETLVSANIRAWRQLLLNNIDGNEFIYQILKKFYDNFPQVFPEFSYLVVPVVYQNAVKHFFHFMTEEEILSYPLCENHLFCHVLITTDRGTTHELVRHRPASFAQESTRYVRYNNIEVIRPVWWDSMTDNQKMFMKHAALNAEFSYRSLIESGMPAQIARQVLPNFLKADINIKTNLFHWKQIFELRCSKAAHPQIRSLMFDILDEMTKIYPNQLSDLRDNLYNTYKTKY